MSRSWREEESGWERRLGEELLQEGFEVILEPSAEQLPFDLGGYLPDLIATRGDMGLILELKRAEHRLTLDRYVEVALIVRRNYGWRFLLVPVDQLDPQGLLQMTQLPSYVELKRRADVAISLFRQELYAPAFLTGWSAIEGFLRVLAEENAVPASTLSPIPLIKHLYSHGVLSIEQLKELEGLVPVRNRVAHGFEPPLVAEASQRLVDVLLDLFDFNSDL